MGSAACNVSVGLGESKGGALQSYVDRVGQCGMVSLWVIALDLIHPALMTKKWICTRTQTHNPSPTHVYTHKKGILTVIGVVKFTHHVFNYQDAAYKIKQHKKILSILRLALQHPEQAWMRMTSQNGFG